MSLDISGLFSLLGPVIAIGILALGIFRAIQMGRAFVNPIYRSRAFWTAAVMVFATIEFLNGYVPYPSSTVGLSVEVSFLLGVVGALPFSAFLMVFFAFIDRTILVAMEMDFFHRETLHWSLLRRSFYIVLLVALILAIGGGSYSASSPNAPQWLGIAVTTLFVVLVTVIGYSAIALVIGARRTPDRTIRRHVSLLGFAVVGYIIATLFSNNSVPALSIIGGLSALAAVYLLYRAVMSLSPIGRVERDISTPLSQVSTIDTKEV